MSTTMHALALPQFVVVRKDGYYLAGSIRVGRKTQKIWVQDVRAACLFIEEEWAEAVAEHYEGYIACVNRYE